MAALPQPQINQRFGARISRMNDGTILVQQTIKSGPNQNDRYVIDDNDGKRERFVSATEDDAAVGRAVCDAVAGQLES